MLTKLIRFNKNFVRSITQLAASPIEQNDIKIKKLKLNDKELAQTILTIKSKKKMRRDQKIIVEGDVLIKEALNAKLKPDKFIFSDIRKLNEFYKEVKSIVGREFASSIECLKVPQTDLTFYATLTTCPGIIAIFNKPESIPEKKNALPITVLSDGCKEPNNVGALIRICNAVTASKLLLPKGNVDIWDTKCIRGSSGSVFYFPSESQLSWEEVDEKVGSNSLVLIADNNLQNYNPEKVFDYDKIPDDLLMSSSSYCVIIGGETQGISKEARQFARRRDWRVVNIPIDPTANSLNISNALAVILFELRRKLNLVM